MRGRCGRTTFWPSAWMAPLGRKSCVGMGVLFAVGAQGSHHQKAPPGPPRPLPSLGLPARHFPLFPAISRHFFHLSKCPRAVSRSGWASRRALTAAAPVALRAPSAPSTSTTFQQTEDTSGSQTFLQNLTHTTKERSILHKQGNFLHCVDNSRHAAVNAQVYCLQWGRNFPNCLSRVRSPSSAPMFSTAWGLLASEPAPLLLRLHDVI